jgi:uncharacterized membrane protein YidH (DUF202 family)
MEAVTMRRTARIAGVFYLMDFAFGPALYAIRKFVVSGDAAQTATNIVAHQTLFQLGFAGNLIAIATYVVVTALFYQLFKPVNRTVSLLAAFMSLMGCAVLAVGCVFYLAALPALPAAQQSPTLALMFIKLYAQSFNTSFVFFGCYCLLIGYLIFRSTFMPRILGVGMMLAGLGWGLTFLWPPLVHYLSPYVMLSGVGEAALIVWLLVKGVDSDRWNEQAAASRLAS